MHNMHLNIRIKLLIFKIKILEIDITVKISFIPATVIGKKVAKIKASFWVF